MSSSTRHLLSSGHRPLYETDSDLASESRVAAHLEGRWDCRLIKLPIKYGMDYAAVRDVDRVSAYIEIKVRNNRADKYPTLLLSLDKYMSADRLSRLTGVPSLIVVSYTDALKWAVLATAAGAAQREARMGGRVDRNDWQDIEPVVHIEVSEFKSIELDVIPVSLVGERGGLPAWNR